MTHGAVTRALLLAALLARPVGAEVVNLLAFHEGTVPVVEPSSYGSWTAMTMLDDDPASGWAAEGGHVKDNVFVFELADTPGTFERANGSRLCASMRQYAANRPRRRAHARGAREVLAGAEGHVVAQRHLPWSHSSTWCRSIDCTLFGASERGIWPIAATVASITSGWYQTISR
jgi:hypothetical protein